MLRCTALLLCLATSTAAAQSDSKAWTGTWEGTAQHVGQSSPTIALRIDIGRDSIWSVTMHVAMPDHPIDAPGTSIAVEASRATWNAAIAGMTCKTTATIEGAKLKGETKCSEHAALTFELTKTKN